MHFMYFTEQPMNAYPEEKVEDRVGVGGGRSLGVTALMFSNKYFDPVEGSRLYNERLEEYRLVDEVGFDGIMLNEHHTAPFCMSPRIMIFASILAAMTEHVKIVLLGYPLPITESPVHAAEELAIVDMISKGRLVSGLVRGGGVENIQANVNPIHNRERFEEAHDLLIKTWTTPGPFRWEGRHYQFRVVNPWAVPLQKPHPRIFIPGISSRETVVWAAKHRYPYIGLNTNYETNRKIRALYAEAAQEVGYEPGPENFGVLLQCHVAETEEKAYQNAKEFMWMAGEFTGLTHPVWGTPSGYSSPGNRNALIDVAAGRRVGPKPPPLDKRLEQRTLLYGTPAQVVAQLKEVIQRNELGIVCLWGNDGRVNHEDSKTCIRLMGQEVLPEIREFCDREGYKGPFDGDVPVSAAYS